MSFGYSIGDIIKLVELTNKIRHRFVDAPGQFRAISDEVRSLTIVLEDVKILLPRRELSSTQRKQLVDIVTGCFSLLNELSKKLDEYPELDSVSPANESLRLKLRTVRKRLKWEPKDIEDLRMRIASSLALLNTFYAQLNQQTSWQIKDTITEIRDQQVQHVRSECHQAILEWLTPVDYAPQHSDFSSRRQKGTCQWLLDSEAFQRWLAQPKQTMFCPGIPGAGKTILASCVINHLFDESQGIEHAGISYVYGNFRRQGEQRPIDILLSLLKQFLRGLQSVPEPVSTAYEISLRTGTRPSLEDLSRLFVSVLGAYKRCFVVIDALDECRAQDPACKGLLSELFRVQEQTSMNVFVTSRFIPEIMEQFKEASGIYSVQIAANGDDVREYLQGHLSQLPAFVANNTNLQTEIVTEIAQSIDGMFLLAQLQLDSLIGKRSPKAIRTALQSLRKESKANRKDKNKVLGLAYKHAMERIEGQIGDQSLLAKQVLSWITCAHRPLKTSELQCALAVEPETDEVDEENLPELEDMVSVCAGLITVDKVSDVVRLVHYTTQEYFENTWTTWFPEAPSEITNVCITYLSFEAFGGGACPRPGEFDTRKKEHPLYEYAAGNWGHHARGGHGDETSILRFLADEQKVAACAQAFPLELSQIYAETVTALHTVAYFGLHRIAAKLIGNGHVLDPSDDSRRTPLIYAASKGYSLVVDMLLEAGARADLTDTHGWNALSYAVHSGHAAVVESLIKQPLEINHKESRYGRTALWQAVSQGDAAVVTLLLAHPDIDLEIRDSVYNRTPLWEAAANGHYVVARMLVAAGRVDVDPTDSYFDRTPLWWAARNGHEEMVKLLLTSDEVDFNSRDPHHGTTPLWWAAGNGHEGIVKLLLAKDTIDVNAKDTYYRRTPLWEAAANGHITVVKVLVADPRVDLESKPSYM